MRYRMSIAAALAFAAIQTTSAAAQVDANPPASTASVVTPLPASLVPDADPAAGEATARISARRVLVSAGIGTLAGAGAGLLVGAITTDGCQPGESWCILGWEEEVAIHGVAGAMVGAGVGALYGLVASPRHRSLRNEPAPLTVAAAVEGGLRVG